MTPAGSLEFILNFSDYNLFYFIEGTIVSNLVKLRVQFVELY